MPSSPSSHASCSINQHILQVLLPKYISHLFLYTSLLYYPHPSHYHILSGLFSQPTKCDPCYLCFCFYLASFSSLLTQQFHTVKAHLISLFNLKLLTGFQTPCLVLQALHHFTLWATYCLYSNQICLLSVPEII